MHQSITLLGQAQVTSDGRVATCLYAKRHQFEAALDGEEDGEDGVEVLQNLRVLTRLTIELQHTKPSKCCKEIVADARFCSPSS